MRLYIRGPHLGPVHSILWSKTIHPLRQPRKQATWYYGKLTLDGQEIRCFHHHRSLGAAEACADTALRTGNIQGWTTTEGRVFVHPGQAPKVPVHQGPTSPRGIMKITRIAVVIGAAGMLLAGLGATTAASVAPVSASSPPASASHSLPKVQTQGMFGGWHNHGWKVRPGAIYFGAHYGIGSIRWTSWTAKAAWGKGHMFVGITYPVIRVKIHMWGVKSHSGPGRYFKYLHHTGGKFSDKLWISGGVWTNR